MSGHTKGVLIDVDDHWPQAGDRGQSLGRAVHALKKADIDVRFLSHNSSLGVAAMQETMRRHGIRVSDGELFTPTNVLARELSIRENRATVFLIGSAGFHDDLYRQGLRVIEHPEEIGYLADFVVVGHDPDLDHAKLNRALRCLLQGAQWAIADDTIMFSADESPTAGPGATVAAIRALTDQQPALHVKAPRARVLQRAWRSLDHPAEQCAIATGADWLREAAEEAEIPLIASRVEALRRAGIAQDVLALLKRWPAEDDDNPL